MDFKRKYLYRQILSRILSNTNGYENHPDDLLAKTHVTSESCEEGECVNHKMWLEDVNNLVKDQKQLITALIFSVVFH